MFCAEKFCQISSFCTGRGFRKPAGRVIKKQRRQNQQHGCRHADRICGCDGPEDPVTRKNKVNPADMDTADTGSSQKSGRKRDAESAQIAGHDFIKHAESVREHDHHKAGASGGHDAGIVAKKCEQRFPEKENQQSGRGISGKTAGHTGKNKIEMPEKALCAKQRLRKGLFCFLAKKRVGRKQRRKKTDRFRFWGESPRFSP